MVPHANLFTLDGLYSGPWAVVLSVVCAGIGAFVGIGMGVLYTMVLVHL